MEQFGGKVKDRLGVCGNGRTTQRFHHGRPEPGHGHAVLERAALDLISLSLGLGFMNDLAVVKTHMAFHSGKGFFVRGGKPADDAVVFVAKG